MHVLAGYRIQNNVYSYGTPHGLRPFGHRQEGTRIGTFKFCPVAFDRFWLVNCIFWSIKCRTGVPPLLWPKISMKIVGHVALLSDLSGYFYSVTWSRYDSYDQMESID